jgi:hypothetical protein
MEGWFPPRLKSACTMVQIPKLQISYVVGADGSVECVLERDREDDGRAAFGRRKAVFMPHVAGLGLGSPRRGRAKDGKGFPGCA